MTLPIPDLNLSGPYFNADGSPNTAGLQLLRVINAVKARTGGILSDGVSEASATATGGATQTLAEWFADVEAATSGLAAHVADTSAAHAASAISYSGGTGMSATDVEAAIDELAAEKANAAVTLTAGLGISGGGDISTDRSFAFAPSELTDAAIVTGDGLVFMDVSDSNNPKRRTVSSLISDLTLAQTNGAVSFAGDITDSNVAGDDNGFKGSAGGTLLFDLTREGNGVKLESFDQVEIWTDAFGTLGGGTRAAMFDGGAMQARIALSSETSGTLTSASANKKVKATGGITINDGVFSAEDKIQVYNDSDSSITITQDTGMTLRLSGTTSTGNRTLAARGLALIDFDTNADAAVGGTGVS